MTYNPEEEMPTTVEQFNILVDHMAAKSKAEYDEAVVKARKSAIAQWDVQELKMRETVLKQAVANIAAMTEDGPDGPVPLPKEKAAQLLSQAETELDADLARQRKEYIEQAVSMVEPAKDKAYWEQLYKAAGYFPQEQETFEMPVPTTEELFAQLRSIREVKFREYDEAVSQLEREARTGENVAARLSAWDAYAIALCELPEQPGAPWDGGGVKTPWPVKP